MHDVFISYSHKNKTIADAICARLESEKIRCWYAPRDIAPGSDWAASIIDAIKQSKIMVLVFSDYSNASSQVLREVSSAVSSGIPLVPFKMTDSPPSDGMQYYLATVHWLDAMNLPLEKSVNMLYELVNSILNGTPKSETETPTPVQPKKKKPLIPIIACAAVLVAAACTTVFFFPKGGKDTETTKEQYVDTVELVTETGNALEIISPPEEKPDGISDVNNTGTVGNTQSNYQNDGLACTDGEWFYFQGNDHQNMYRMRLDGSEKSKINNTPSKNIGIMDNYIYYYTNSADRGIYRMRPDGTENTCLHSSAIEDLMLIDERIYFRESKDGLRLYSMACDGTDLKKENDLTELYSLTIWNGRIYWSNQAKAGKLCSANLDGTDLQVLTDSAIRQVTVVDGWLIYNEGSDFYQMNIETKEKINLFSKEVDKFVVSEYGIFAIDSSKNIYRAALGSHEMQKITDQKARYYVICAGYIFYRDEDTGKGYIMKYDGSTDDML